MNGYGVYGEGTDRLHVSHNLIGRCRHSGYYLKPVPFRMHGMLRGGTSRDAKIRNNIFYDCGEAAIDFPTRDNEAEGNLYVRMQGGYLRVMYPEPENCLDLRSWQEFFGFDKEGQNAWFDIDLDEETGEAVFSPAEKPPFGFPRDLERQNMILEPEKVRKVPADKDLPYEQEEKVLPGPWKKFRIKN